jgi:hypothetical protein
MAAQADAAVELQVEVLASAVDPLDAAPAKVRPQVSTDEGTGQQATIQGSAQVRG